MTYPENMPPKFAEKLAAELRARAAEHGWVLATRCQHCRAPLWDTKSVAAHAGPVCRARHKKNDPSASNLAGERAEAVETIPTT